MSNVYYSFKTVFNILVLFSMPLCFSWTQADYVSLLFAFSFDMMKLRNYVLQICSKMYLLIFKIIVNQCLLCSFLQPIIWIVEVTQKYQIISLNHLSHFSNSAMSLTYPWYVNRLCKTPSFYSYLFYLDLVSLWPRVNQFSADLTDLMSNLYSFTCQ